MPSATEMLVHFVREIFCAVTPPHLMLIFAVLLLLIATYGDVSSYKSIGVVTNSPFMTTFSRVVNKQATLSLGFADQQRPAVDRYAQMPLTSPLIKLKLPTGMMPAGPDPFKLVVGELQPLSEYIKDLLASENPILTMAASHFFNKV